VTNLRPTRRPTLLPPEFPEIATPFSAFGKQMADLVQGVGALNSTLSRVSGPESLSPGSLQEIIQDEIGAQQFAVLSYPNDSAKRAMPNGIVQLNLLEGLVERDDISGGERLSSSLNAGGFNRVNSGIIWADSELLVQFQIDGVSSGSVFMPQGSFLPFEDFPVDRIILKASQPYDFAGTFSTQKTLKLDTRNFVADQERYATNTTTDDWSRVLWTPTGARVVSDYLAASFRRGDIFTRDIGMKIFMVVNTGDNAADVNIQFQEADRENWVDDPNTTDSSSTVGANSATIFEAGINARAVRMRVKSNAAGSAATMRLTYRGISLVR
jgi:hypothetical protein